VPAVDEVVSPALRTFGEPPVDVAALYVPTTAYVVLGLSQIDRVRPRDGLIIPTVEVSFRVPGLPGTFTIRIDNYAFTHADVLRYLRERAYMLRAMFRLPAPSPAYVDDPASVTLP
jgi:hypothetical protein